MIASKEFKNQIDCFYRDVLSQFGYLAPSENHAFKPLSGEGIDYKFVQPNRNFHISISFFKLLRDSCVIQFSMFEMEPNSKLFKKVFVLENYKRKNEFKKIISESEPGQNTEYFVKAYFDGLAEACNTYLSDQVSGVSFEEHSKYPDEM